MATRRKPVPPSMGHPKSNQSNRKPPRKVPPRRSTSQNWLWLGMGLVGVAMLSATAGALLAVSFSSTPLLQSKLSPQEAAVFGDESISRTSFRLSELTRPVNILVMGIKVISSDLDNPPEETKNLGYHALVNSFDGLSDTMLLIRFNPETRKIAVLSIPRDTRTYIDGVGQTKINAANVHGGPALTAKTTSDLLNGVAIDRYIRINVQGVEKLIDALGGVTVFVPKDMKYRDESQHLYINLKAGKQHLNGDQTLQLLRYRYDKLGDIGRIQRQQMVMSALMEQALNPQTLGRMPKILSVIQSHLDTNLTVEELLALTNFGIQTKRANMQMLMLPGEFSGAGRNEVSYWIPYRRRIQAMMAQHFDQGIDGGTIADPSQLRIAIQDSTNNPEAVRFLMQKLRDSGYNNVSVDEPWPEPLKSTRVVAQQGDGTSAAAIQKSLGFGEVRVESTGQIVSDITIQVGNDWQKKQGGFSFFGQ